jgi:hypothetical protein
MLDSTFEQRQQTPKKVSKCRKTDLYCSSPTPKEDNENDNNYNVFASEEEVEQTC